MEEFIRVVSEEEAKADTTTIDFLDRLRRRQLTQLSHEFSIPRAPSRVERLEVRVARLEAETRAARAAVEAAQRPARKDERPGKNTGVYL